jgi:hypothetical protein
MKARARLLSSRGRLTGASMTTRYAGAETLGAKAKAVEAVRLP